MYISNIRFFQTNFEELAADYLENDGILKKLHLLKNRKFDNIIITGMGTSYAVFEKRP